MKTVSTSFFRIRCKPDLNHRCFAPIDYINHAPPRHGSRPSPLHPIFISLQRTTTPGFISRSSSLCNMRNNPFYAIPRNILRFYHIQVPSISRLVRLPCAHIHIVSRTCLHLRKSDPRRDPCSQSQIKPHVNRQGRYTRQPPLNALKIFQAPHIALKTVRICF